MSIKENQQRRMSALGIHGLTSGQSVLGGDLFGGKTAKNYEREGTAFLEEGLEEEVFESAFGRGLRPAATALRFVSRICEGATPAEIVAMFEPGAYVLPTLWTQGETQADLLAYFQYFLVPGRCGRITSLKTAPLGPNFALATGLWEWWVGEAGWAAPVTKARFSMVVKGTPQGPRIAHLHSSADPQAEEEVFGGAFGQVQPRVCITAYDNSQEPVSTRCYWEAGHTWRVQESDPYRDLAEAEGFGGKTKADWYEEGRQFWVHVRRRGLTSAQAPWPELKRGGWAKEAFDDGYMAARRQSYDRIPRRTESWTPRRGEFFGAATLASMGYRQQADGSYRKKQGELSSSVQRSGRGWEGTFYAYGRVGWANADASTPSGAARKLDKIVAGYGSPTRAAAALREGA
jgi:hypothetical protein